MTLAHPSRIWVKESELNLVTFYVTVRAAGRE